MFVHVCVRAFLFVHVCARAHALHALTRVHPCAWAHLCAQARRAGATVIDAEKAALLEEIDRLQRANRSLNSELEHQRSSRSVEHLGFVGLGSQGTWCLVSRASCLASGAWGWWV